MLLVGSPGSRLRLPGTIRQLERPEPLRLRRPHDYGMYAGTAVYKLVAPAVATSNLTITFWWVPNAVAGVLALTGVDQATPLGTT